MTFLILGFLSAVSIGIVIWMWTQIESDADCSLDCNQGRQCAGHCVNHQPCPTPFQCHLGAKQ